MEVAIPQMEGVCVCTLGALQAAGGTFGKCVHLFECV